MVDGGGRRVDKPVATKPTVGRIVHFGGSSKDGGTQERAAIIADVNPGNRLNLTVCSWDGSTYGIVGVAYSPVLTRGYWTWPPRG